MNRMRVLRKEKGLTQIELSNKLKNLGIRLSKTSISAYERGKLSLSDEKLFQVAKYFGVSMAYLKGKSDIWKRRFLDNKFNSSNLHYNNICFERVDMGLTQAELGRLIGVSKSYISEYERGTREVPSELWKVLKTEVSYLQGINGKYYRYSERDKDNNLVQCSIMQSFVKSLDDEILSNKMEDLLKALKWAYDNPGLEMLYFLFKFYSSQFNEKEAKLKLNDYNNYLFNTLETIIFNTFLLFMQNFIEDEDLAEKQLFKILSFFEE